MLMFSAICFAQQNHQGHKHDANQAKLSDPTIKSQPAQTTKKINAQQQKTGHEGHNHDGHNHHGHSHEGHDHSGHNHAGHNHGTQKKAQPKKANSHQGHNHAGHNHGGHNHAGHDHGSHDHGAHDHDGDHHHHGPVCGVHQDHSFNPGTTAFHHIADANVYSIGPLQIPLPCMLYAPKEGWSFFMSSKLKFHSIGHGDGHMAYDGYVLDGGSIKKVVDPGFTKEHVPVSGFVHKDEMVDGKKKHVAYVCQNNKLWKLDSKSTADGGLFGGGITSYYDFSLTKNVVSMLLVVLFLSWLFLKVAKAYKTRAGLAPKGSQGFIEVMFAFIQDEVAKPFLGEKYMKYLPFLMAIFFFVLGLNLFGQIPFFGGSNVTGNLAVTAVLAICAFVVTNISGTKDYWKHILNMPGVPGWVKIILTPVELLGVFIKPLTLMLRLFANITAGHMVIIIFLSLIFIFGKTGDNMIGGYATAIPAGLLTLFMMAIELLVAFIQAFVFTILTASYIGAAIETHDDHH